jgi:tetratricopeptide (TPR) repeat protein
MLFAHRALRLALLSILLASLAACGGAASRFDAYLKHGQEYFAAGDYARAGVEFRNAMQIEPRNAEARIMAARTLEKQGRLREAIGLLQSAVEIAPDNTEARANLARLLLFGGGAEQAMKILEPALKGHPDDPLLLTLRAAARQQLGKQAEAVADVDRALKLDPSNIEAIEVRAGFYRHAGDLAGALTLITAAVVRDPRSTELHEALVDLYEAQGERAKAEGELRTLIALAPRVPRYRYQLANFYVRQQRLDDAQKVMEEAVKALPQNNDVKLALVEFVSTQRTRAQGEELLRGFIAREPDNYDLRLGLGALFERSGAAKEAADTYQEIVRRDAAGPKGLIARDRLARMAFVQGRAEDAAKLVAQVLEQSPRDNDALVLHGELALAHSNPSQAITDFRAVLRDQPQAVGVHRLLAQGLLANRDTALAEETLRNAAELAPDDAALRVDRARVLVQLQRADEAVALLEETARRAPADVAVREELAVAYLAKHDYAAARTAAEDLGRLRPQAAAGPYLAGLAAEGAGQSDLAQKQLQHALELEPRSFDVLSALARLMLSRGEGAQAAATVAGAAGRGPPDAHLLNLLGEMQLAQRKLPAAIDAFTRSSTAAPGWWIPYRNLALAKVASHDEAGAIAAYQAAVKAAPDEAQPVTELALYYESHGRAGDAIALYRDSSRKNPRSQLLANNLAVLLVRYRTDQASLDEARDLSASFSASSDSNLLDTNGWVHFKRAEYAQALPVLQRAVARAPDSPELRYHLGMAEWRSGNSAGALKDLEAALAGSGKFAGAEDARAALASLRNRSG